MPENKPLSFRFLEENEKGMRLDQFLKSQLEVSRNRIQNWIEHQLVLVNSLPGQKKQVLRSGDTIEVSPPEDHDSGPLVPENIPLQVHYEDEFLAVVEKPKGMVTHPGHGVKSGTLANALAYRFQRLSDLGGNDRPGIVHRLDRNTSGLLLVARDNQTHALLSTQLAQRQIHRQYHALCWREPTTAEGTYSWPLGRHPKDPLRRAVVPDGKISVTHFRVQEYYQFATHLTIQLETGRTHQIRVHFSHAGFPIAGDEIYGGGSTMLTRFQPLLKGPASGLLKKLSSQALHAARLEFRHPHKDQALVFNSPLPDEFQIALEYLIPFRRQGSL